MRFARNLKAIWNGSQHARFVVRSLSDDGWSVWDRRERRFLNRREIARLTPRDLNGSGEGLEIGEALLSQAGPIPNRP
jgi:hypothetical protein